MDRIGRYKIVRELGRGAMGVVYHAIDPNIGRPVAIKTIVLDTARKPEEQERMRERLFREARSAGILSHPGIVTIYDVEQHGSLAYIAMEYVDGPTLNYMLSEPSAFSPERIFSILGQTAAALDYAHQKGIVHRDIKPANIMIAADGTVKITDFGIAKIAASEQFTLTASIVGTPHYMSPEQVQGLSIDGRSDQFSLAVIAFEMLTGEKPYTGEHLTTVVYKIVAEAPPMPRSLNPTLSRDIESVIQKGLSKKPADRFRTCQEFVSALEKACSASKGWKPLPRGGSLTEPTLAEESRRAVLLPPARQPLRRGRTTETVTAEVPAGSKGGFFTFLLAMLVAAGLLALIGSQAVPWISKKPGNPEVSPLPGKEPPAGNAELPFSSASKRTQDSSSLPAKPPSFSPLPERAPETQVMPPVSEPRPAKDDYSADDAGSGLAPRSRKETPVQRQPQPVSVISSPGAATATLDGHPETSCTTPCVLNALPGRHSISVSMPGYDLERREVFVGAGPVEMPAVVLHAIGGSLMLTSEPQGARVLVDGKPTGQVTPAEIRLRPGSYRITIEKEGKQVSQTVEVRAGISYLKLLLGQ
jgi:serine/threonine protein kinase